MLRTTVLAACLLTVSPLAAQDWASKMFPVRTHDFGTVPRASKHEYAFELTNHYKDDIHISAVRTSCGCTTPKITKQRLASGETGSIVSVFNTLHFLGQRRATITVTIDRPQYAEVQLQITGYVRQDVVLSPSVVDFGTVSEDQGEERKVALQYAGRSDWTITDFRCPDYLECEASPADRTGGRVKYDLTVKLKKNAPQGYLSDQLVLVTNDSRHPEVQLTVEGRIATSLSVSPSSLVLGDLSPGQEVTKQIVVRGQRPFRIVSIDCPHAGFRFTPSDEAKTLHLVPVAFTAGPSAEKVIEDIQIKTDLDGDAEATVKVFATVAAPVTEQRVASER
jgi:hypothetical protein